MPSSSKSQQRFFGVVRAVQRGDMDSPSEDISEAAKSMSTKDVSDFAKTKHAGLPEKVEETKEVTEKDASIAKFGAGFVTTCKEAGLDMTDTVELARGLGQIDTSLFASVVEALDE